VENLTSLFLRPNTNVRDFAAQPAGAPTRQVGFGGVETWSNDENSFGDDGDCGGFVFGGEDDHDDEPVGDFVVPELDGVRKVEKVKVGYATVAKKVDVKRLKKDLWEELERTFQERDMLLEAAANDKDDADMNDGMSEQEAEREMKQLDEVTNPKSQKQQQQNLLSFHDTVREMQSTRSQADATLPFYFICILHLANEKGLALESLGLEDFIIHNS